MSERKQAASSLRSTSCKPSTRSAKSTAAGRAGVPRRTYRSWSILIMGYARPSGIQVGSCKAKPRRTGLRCRAAPDLLDRKLGRIVDRLECLEFDAVKRAFYLLDPANVDVLNNIASFCIDRHWATRTFPR